MPLADVVGHSQVISVLKRTILTNRVASGYLFLGPPNVGKSLVAIELAKALNCLSEPAQAEAENCGACEACRNIAKGIYPDVLLIRPLMKLQEESEEEAATGQAGPPGGAGQAREVTITGAIINVKQLDEVLLDASRVALEARRKVYIIDAAETMNLAAANRLLKTLEEPPALATFIIITAYPGTLLPTIISRCHSMQFHPVPLTEATPALQAIYPQLEPETVAAIAALSGGRFGWAHTMLARPQVMAQREALLALVASLPHRQPFEALGAGEKLMGIAEQWWTATEEGDLAADLLKKNRDRVLRTMMGDVLDVFIAWFRDLSLLTADRESEAVINRDHLGKLRELWGAYTVEDCVRACRIVEDTKVALRGNWNVNLRLACEALMVRLISLTAAP